MIMYVVSREEFFSECLVAKFGFKIAENASWKVRTGGELSEVKNV